MAVKHTDRKLKKNAKWLLCFLCVGAILFNVISLGSVIFVKGGRYRQEAESQQMSDTVLTAPRGTIYDKNMNVLAKSTSAWICCATPANIKTDETRQDIAKFLSELFDSSYDKLLEKLSDKSSKYTILQKQVTAKEKQKIEEFIKRDDKGYQGIIYFTPSTTRYYPSNNFASSVLGFINADGEGMGGIEYVYNTQLTGTPGRIITAKDAKGESMSSDYETVIDAKEGTGLILTLDSTIQYYLEKALSEALEDYDALGTYGIVMDVDTGAILAMANKPDFDSNNAYQIYDKETRKKLEKYKDTKKYNEKYTNALYEQWNNKAVSYTYEPGSVFKTITLAAALEENVVNEKTTYCCTGVYNIGGWDIHCVNRRGHGTQTLCQGLMNSCNPFFITIGQKLGSQTYFDYFEAFGFTEKTGIDLPGEAAPVANVTYHPADNFSSVDLASTSFGQTINVTPIQMITAVSAIANGGKLMKPYIVAGTVDADGNVLTTTENHVRRQVISESTAQKAREMMEQVVSAGSGKNGYIPGYRVAGKTATSQKLSQSQKAGKDLYSASFVCFAPSDDPEIAVLIIVDEPGGSSHGGGAVAAPVAREVLQSALEYLNVEPEYTEKELATLTSTAPNLVGSKVTAAKQTAANQGYSTKVVGSGDKVIAQNPGARQSMPSGGVIILYTEEDKRSSTVEVPDFSGKSIAVVNQMAVDAGINITFSGPKLTTSSTVSYKQSVPAGEKVEAGSRVTVYFREMTGIDDTAD